MNFLKNELGIKNIQNLRRGGSTGTQKLKNIGAFLGKTVGNLLLAGGLLGGLAKAGSVGASLIKEDMEVGFRRFGTNPLERYGNPHRPSTLARPFPGHGTSLTRAVYDNTGLARIRRLIKTNRVFELPLPAHEWYSDLKVRPSLSSRWLGGEEETQTLAKINELRGPLNEYYMKKKLNKVRELRQTWETNLRRRGNIGWRGEGSFPESLIGEFFQRPIPEFVEDIPPFVPQRHTAEINQLMDDYFANILKNDRKSRAVNRFIDAVLDQKFTSRRIRSDITFEDEYLDSRNFQSVEVRARIHSMREYSTRLQSAVEENTVCCCMGCCCGLLCIAGFIFT